MRAKATADRDYNVKAQDILDYEEMYGKIPSGSMVLIMFGWAKKGYSDYWGTEGTDSSQFHFPGISLEAGKILVERGIYGYGADTASTDYGPSTDFPLHYYFSSKNIYTIENVGDMTALPVGNKGVTVIVGLMKHELGSGGAVRLVALVDDDSTSPATINVLSEVVLLLSVFGTLNY